MAEFSLDELLAKGAKPQAKELSLEELKAMGAKPASEIKEQPNYKERTTRKLEAGLRGAVTGLTSNLAPVAAGALGTAGNFLKGNPEGLLENYRNARDLYKKENEVAHGNEPHAYKLGQTAGGIAQTELPGVGLSKTASPVMRAIKSGLLGAASGFGYSPADVSRGEIGQAALDTAKGAGLAALTQGATEKLLPAAGNYLSQQAEKNAVAATGATRNQAEKFAKDAGRQLLDRKLVKPLDTPGSIAKRAGELKKTAYKNIDKSLQEADELGIKVNPEELVTAIESTGKRLKGGGNAGERRALQHIKEDLADELGVNKMGPHEAVHLQEVEEQKRSFGRNYNPDPDKQLAKKSAYKALLDLTERKMGERKPELQKSFTKEKQTYGLLAPIEEAAQRRQLQLQNHPRGGFLDTTAAGIGLGAGEVLGSADRENQHKYGLLGTLAAPILRRHLGPRINPTLAVGQDALSKLLRKIPPKEAASLATGLLQSGGAYE